jgi:ABC-type Fe3+/spermidine/putrescine transport system ATPase subunit
MSHVSKIYRTDLIETYALREVSLEVAAGEFVAVMGPSGSGKTTFLNVTGLLETFDGGRYELDGTDVTALSDRARSRARNEKVGFIFQSFNLIPDLNVYDNEPEGAYVPWGWSRALQLRSSGTTRCWKVETIDTFEQLVGSECAWVQMWVELGGAAARDRMQAFIDAYWAEQRKGGRFPRPRNNRLTDVPQWLEDNQVVHSDDRLLVGLAFCFLCVCFLTPSACCWRNPEWSCGGGVSR